MKKIKIITVIALLFVYGELFAGPKEPAKCTILVYDFQIIKTPAAKGVKQQKQKDYSYYSFIIPETISKRLKESPQFIITRNNRSIISSKNTSIEAVKNSYIDEFGTISVKTGSDFIITGAYEVKNGSLQVKVFLFDAAKKELEEIAVENRETGIYLKDTTDNLSDDLETKLYIPVKAAIEKKGYSGNSPFYPLAVPLLYTTLGLDTGYLTPQGDWKDKFNKTIYYSPYLTFDLAKYLEMSLKYDYFQTDTEDMEIISYYKVRVMGGAASLGLRLPLFSNFLICIAAGGGISRTTITSDMEEPFSVKIDDEKSTDYTAEGEISMKLKLSSLQFKAGALYKRYFYEDKAADISVFFGGVGIHF